MAIKALQIVRRRLLRGEAAVAGIGLAAAIIMLVIVAASAIWAKSVSSDALAAARKAELERAASSLAASLEATLSDNDLSSTRRLVIECGQALDLEICRVTLSNQEIVADLHPASVTVRKLPQSWSVGAIETSSSQSTDGFRITQALRIGGRGAAVLELQAAQPNPDNSLWNVQAGIGAIGAVGLCALLLVYRRLRNRNIAAEAVREALLAFAAGESSPEALTVDAELGAEAEGWNRLLAEFLSLRQAGAAKRVIEGLGDRRRGSGDLSKACDSLSQGLLLVDDQMKVQFVNGAAAVLLKRRRDDFIGQPVAAVITNEKIMSGIRSVAQQGLRRPVTAEIENTSSGSVLRFSTRPVRNEDKGAAMIVIEDITQQRVADRSRNTFISQVTHELRTPLTNIRLYVENAIDDINTDKASVEQNLNVINSEARRLERVVGEMLSVAEIDAGCMKLKTDDIRLETLFTELKKDYEAQAADKRITLAFNLPPKFPAITGDRDKITLALHNLVGNALKYTNPGGTVTVTADTKDSQFVIDVADTGIGIKPEETERIFERFYRANDPRIEKITGTGLGLTLAREVIRMHGGDVTVESQFDHGSTFTARLPIQKQAA